MIGKLLGLVERGWFSALRRLRREYYRWSLKQLGQGCVFDRNLRLFGKPCISIGNRVNLNQGVTIQSCEGAEVRIGNGVVLSYDCMILTGGLDRQRGGDARDHVVSAVHIEDDAWIGARAIILPGVTIGRESLVAAGSVVTRSVPANSLVAGVPAKVVRSLNSKPEAAND